jgi:hypothetical protein
LAYGIYLTIDQSRWVRGDYSDTNLLTGTIYSDLAKTTAFDLTGYTLKIRIFKRWQNTELFGKTATIVTAASGTWSYAVAVNEMVAPGNYMIAVEISQTGEVLSTFPEEFVVTEMPA